MGSLEEFYKNFIALLPQLTIGLIVLIVSILISILIRRVIIKRLEPRTKNPLLLNFIGRITALVINIFGFILFLGIIGLGDVSTKILAGAGIITFVVGFAFKDIGENFLSGILLAFKSPFGINDLIETEKTIGYVTEVTLRETVIKTLDGKDVFIPNAQILKNPLINYTVDGFLCYSFTIAIEYKLDLQKAIETIKHSLKNIDEVLTGEKSPLVLVKELQEKKAIISIDYWIDTSKSKSSSYHNKIKSLVLKDVSANLIEHGFINL